MPKEVAHWVIAQRVMERLPPGRLADAVRRHPNCLALGAIFHDVGYYSRGAAGKALLAFADRLHGARGEDTNEILRQLSPALARIDDKPWLVAFLVGAVTHIVADRELHPLVYYFTGNYYDVDPTKQARAAEAHRRLEALMDLRLVGGLAEIEHFSLRRILRDLEAPPTVLVGEVARLLDLDDSAVSGKDLLAALLFFSRVQWLVRRPLIVKTVGLPLRLYPAERRSLFSLTYFAELAAATDLLARSLDYCNPFSGAPRQATLEGALECIVDASVALCANLPRSLAELAGGESLEIGVAGIPTAEARFFHPYVLAGDYQKIAEFAMLQPCQPIDRER
jgi:hypothetical protein